MTRTIIGALGALVLGVPAFANFNVQTFNTVPGTDSGTAAFSLTGNTLSITLTNNSDVKATGDLLTGVGWNFIGGSGVTIGAPSTAAGQAGYTCTGNGAGTSCIAVSSITPSAAWKSNVATGTVGNSPYDISSFTGNPKGAAIANNSIIPDGKDGLSNDDPYYKGPVTFTLTLSGANVGSITGVSNVFIAFGTGGDGLTTTATPEPGFYGVLSLGIAGIFFARRRNKKLA